MAHRLLAPSTATVLLALLLLLSVLLSACGFTLKGHQDYAFQRLYIAPSGSISAAMVTRLKRMIQAGSRTIVVDDPKAAEAILSIGGSHGQNALSINGVGLVEEFELVLSLNYSLTGADGEVLIPPSLLKLNRSMTYSDQFALAKAAEADVLYRDMENDAVDQLQRRLAAVRTLNAAQKSVPAVRSRAPLPTPPL